MNEQAFRDRAAEEIVAFERDLAALDARPRDCDASEFAARYRRLSQRLALARHRGYRVQWIEHLNELALRGHAQLYRRTRRHTSWLAVLGDVVGELPRALRREWKVVAVAFLVFYGSYLAAYLTVRLDPDLVFAFMDYDEVRGMEQMYDPASEHFLSERPASSDVAMFGFYISNNIGIAFRTFASGVFAGLGSFFFLFYNGIVIGAAAGHLENAEMASTFYPFVIGHGAFELNAIVLSGAAGFMLGWSFLAPGRRSRAHAFTERARSALPIVYGFAIMLVIAALLEAFWSSSHTLGATVRYVVGGVLWLAVVAYLSGVGQPRAT